MQLTQKHQDITGKRNEWFSEMHSEIYKSQRCLLDTILEHFNLEKMKNRQQLEDELSYMNMGFLNNSYDSILEKYHLHDQEFIGHIEMSLMISSRKFRLSIRDNGTGLDSALQEHFFKAAIRSRKYNSLRTTPPGTTGGCGIHLYTIAQILKEKKGSYGFKNLGHLNGAIFWYSIPLESLKG